MAIIIVAADTNLGGGTRDDDFIAVESADVTGIVTVNAGASSDELNGRNVPTAFWAALAMMRFRTLPVKTRGRGAVRMRSVF